MTSIPLLSSCMLCIGAHFNLQKFLVESESDKWFSLLPLSPCAMMPCYPSTAAVHSALPASDLLESLYKTSLHHGIVQLVHIFNSLLHQVTRLIVQIHGDR